MPCAHFSRAFGEGHHHVQVDGAEGLFGTGLLDGCAQAAVGDIHPSAELWQEYCRLADRIFKVGMFGQWPA
ncbi:hypothetical protein D3C73_1454530 [compost metagenome]